MRAAPPTRNFRIIGAMARAITSGIKGGLLRFESAENPSKMASGGGSLDILVNFFTFKLLLITFSPVFASPGPTLNTF